MDYAHIQLITADSFFHRGPTGWVRTDSPSSSISQVAKFLGSITRVGDELACLTLLDFLITYRTPPMSTEGTIEKRCRPELTFHHVAYPLAPMIYQQEGRWSFFPLVPVAVQPDGKLFELKLVVNLKGPITQIQQFYYAVIQF